MKRKRFSNELKTKVALMALKAQKSTSEIASEFGVHVSQVHRWKKQAIEALPEIFAGKQGKTIKNMEKERDKLYQKIGQLQVELDWLKKLLGIWGKPCC